MMLMVLFFVLYVFQFVKYNVFDVCYQMFVWQVGGVVIVVVDIVKFDFVLLWFVLFDLLKLNGCIVLVKVLYGVEIGIDVKILFNVGDVWLLFDLLLVLNQIVQVLSVYVIGDIFVEGYIDSVLIVNVKYELNWEFLLVWVGSVVCYLIECGVVLYWLVVIGWVDMQLFVVGDDVVLRV